MSAFPYQVVSPEPRPVLIHFEQFQRQKKRLEACIFCGQTQQTQSFKGKPVCFHCLRRIPNLFPF
ncbi:MAG: hypothetical protein ACYCVD_06350 [Desulfitobacteriaceae bacterium]